MISSSRITDHCIQAVDSLSTRPSGRTRHSLRARRSQARRATDFIILSYYNYQKFKNSKFQKFKKWTLKVSKISKFLSFRIPQKLFSHFFQGCSLIFLDSIQVFWSNKMKKYGLPEPKSLRNDEMLSFRPLMP